MPSTAGSKEPTLVHYRMPYATVRLEPGPELERAYDELALLVALQGIVNRDAPQLYVLGLSGPGVPDLDGFWWQRMAEMGWEVAHQEPHRAESLPELLNIYGDRPRGLVAWDPQVPATQNVAATLAGAMDLLPVPFRPVDTGGVRTLWNELREHGWTVATWLIHQDGSSLFTGRGQIPGTDQPSTGSAKNDAYRWAIAHYLDTGRSSADHLAYYIDADWLRNPAASSFWNNTLVNHDYYVSHRAFFFDLDPWEDESPVDDPDQVPGTDSRTLAAILASATRRTDAKRMIHVGGFPPWAFKYTDHRGAGGRHAGVPTEWHYAQRLSEYNAFMEADALGFSAIANASFTQHFPLRDHYPQAPAPDRAELVRRGLVGQDGQVVPGRYLAFYVGDFDAPSWLYQAGPSLWGDPERGSVPLSWAFNPNLSLRAGPAMAWTRSVATPNDSFVAGDSGAGYLNPGSLEEPRPSGLPSGLSVWVEHCARFYRQWDLDVTGFVIDGYAPGLTQEGLEAYATFSRGGLVGQKVPPHALVAGMPVLTMATDLGGSPRDAAEAIARLYAPVAGPQFAVARAILQKPSWYRAVTDLASGETSDGGKAVTVLDLRTLLALVAVHERAHRIRKASDARCAVVSVTADGVVCEGCAPVPAPDSGWHMDRVESEPAVVFGPHPRHATGTCYLYLTVRAEAPALASARKLRLKVRYWDAPGDLSMVCEFNSALQTADHRGAYTPTHAVRTAGERVWKQVVWELLEADFRGAQNGGADLRLAASPGLALNLMELSPLGE